jgi:hypothetical protein
MTSRNTATPPLLLLVGLPTSILLAGWVSILRRSPFRVVIFPSILQEPCAESNDYPVIATRGDAESLGPGEIGYSDRGLIETLGASVVDQPLSFQPMHFPGEVASGNAPSPGSLAAAVGMLAPDLIHSLDLGHSAYLCVQARRQMRNSFPIWMASAPEGDFYLNRKIAAHQPTLREAMQDHDALHTECASDQKIATELGFKGIAFPNVPASGCLDPQLFPDMASLIPPSQRNLILIDGDHGWRGRAQHVILAIHRIAPLLKGYQIRVMHTDTATMEMVNAVAEENGLDIAVDPLYPDHSAAVSRLMQARLLIGCGISGGLSTMLLEAMMVGAFPIQSDTECASEWIASGVGGFIVSPHDTTAYANSIASAVTDDKLVDHAASINRKAVMNRWGIDEVAPAVVRGYQDILDGRWNSH